MTERTWTPAESAALRNFFSRGGSGVIAQLRADGPERLSKEDLIKLPGESVARSQLFIEGYEAAVRNLMAMAEAQKVPDDASE